MQLRAAISLRLTAGAATAANDDAATAPGDPDAGPSARIRVANFAVGSPGQAVELHVERHPADRAGAFHRTADPGR